MVLFYAIDMVIGGDIMGLQVASALPPQGGEQKKGF